MTPENPAFIQLAKSVSRIESALLGDPMTGKNGIIHFHDKMKEDLYAIGPNGEPIDGKSNTILERLSDLEDSRKKTKWLFGGAIAAAFAAKFGISALIDKLFNKN